jgi:hypothetical protein
LNSLARRRRGRIRERNEEEESATAGQTLKPWDKKKVARGNDILFGRRSVSSELGAQAPLQFLTHFRHFHAGHYDELARKHFAGLVVVGQLAGHAAILAILIPAETPVRNGLWADELEAPQQRVSLGHLEFLA